MDELLIKLSKSKFRSSFRLNDEMIDYIHKQGIGTIKNHAIDFINERLRPAYIENDGKQTPTKGHPVFIAQHACACCCRSCLEKWHHIPKGYELTDYQVEMIVNLLLTWISYEVQDE